MPNPKSFALLLTSPVLLSACAKEPAAIANSAQLCRDWRHQTVSKDDQLTDKTAAGMESSNNSRTAWGCAWGKNQSKAKS